MSRLYDENNPRTRMYVERDTPSPSFNFISNLKRSKKFEKGFAAVCIAASAYLVGGYFSQDKGHENQVRLPETVIGAPLDIALIDYGFSETPSRQVTKITLLPNEKYDTLMNSNGRLTIKGKVNYDIDCRGIEDKGLCNDTRECQMTFKTIDDKLN